MEMYLIDSMIQGYHIYKERLSTPIEAILCYTHYLTFQLMAY